MASVKTTQAKRILDYMSEFGSITPLEAMRDLGCYRLTSRIFDLRKRGYKISSEWVAVNNRYGGKSRIKKYRLVADDEPSAV